MASKENKGVYTERWSDNWIIKLENNYFGE